MLPKQHKVGSKHHMSQVFLGDPTRILSRGLICTSSRLACWWKLDTLLNTIASLVSGEMRRWGFFQFMLKDYLKQIKAMNKDEPDERICRTEFEGPRLSRNTNNNCLTPSCATFHVMNLLCARKRSFSLFKLWFSIYIYIYIGFVRGPLGYL